MRWQDENNKFTGAPLSLSLVVVVRVCVSQADYCMNNCVRTMNWPLLASYSLFSKRLIHIRIALEAIHISENSSVCAKRTMTDEWKWITRRALCMIIQVCPCPFIANMTSDKIIHASTTSTSTIIQQNVQLKFRTIKETNLLNKTRMIKFFQHQQHAQWARGGQTKF